MWMQKDLFKYSGVNNMTTSIVLFNILIFSDEAGIKKQYLVNFGTCDSSTIVEPVYNRHLRAKNQWVIIIIEGATFKEAYDVSSFATWSLK